MAWSLHAAGELGGGRGGNMLDGGRPYYDVYAPATAAKLRRTLTRRFAERPQADWVALFAYTDACVAPVVPIAEAPEHPHLRAREVYVEHAGLVQPAPALPFSRTEARLGIPPPPVAGADTVAALRAWGVRDVESLLAQGAAVQAEVASA